MCWKKSFTAALVMAMGFALVVDSGHGQDKKDGPGPAADPDSLSERALHRLGTARFRHGDRILCLAFSPNAPVLAAGGGNDPVRLWDTDSGKELRQVKENWVHAIAFTPRGSVFATAGAFKTIKLWETATGKEIDKLRMEGHQTAVRAMVISPDGSMLASGGADGTILLWELLTGKIITTLKGHTDEINGLVFSADSSLLASASSDRTVRLWDADKGKFLKQMDGGCAVMAVAFSQDAKTLYSGGDDNRIRIWSVETGKQTGDKQTHKGTVVSLIVSRDGKALYSGGQDGTIQTWDLVGGKEGSLKRGLGDSDAMALTKDGKFLATAGINNTIRIFDTTAGKEVTATNVHLANVTGMVLADDGRTVASVSADGNLRIWDAKGGENLRSWDSKHTGEISLAFAPGGKVLATASGSDPVRLWDVDNGKAMGEIPTSPEDSILCLQFSPDGQTLARGRRVGGIELLDWKTKAARATIKYAGPVYSVAFSRDSKLLALAGPGKIAVHQAADGKEVKTFQCKEGPPLSLPAIASLAFGADNKTLAAGCYDGVIRLFDSGTGKEIRACEASPPSVAYNLAFSRDGRTLASAQFDRSVRLWETFSGAQIVALQGHQGPATAVAFASNGRTLFSGSADTNVLHWDGTGLMKGGTFPQMALDQGTLQSGFNVLASEDPKPAHQFLWQLVASPKEATAFFATPGQVYLLDPVRVEKLFKDLNSDKYDDRIKATKELERYQRWMEGRLKKALENPPTLEVELRLKRMLEKLDVPGSLSLNQERMRMRRIMMALEQIATPAAIDILQNVARGAPEPELQLEAEASLARLGIRAKAGKQ